MIFLVALLKRFNLKKVFRNIAGLAISYVVQKAKLIHKGVDGGRLFQIAWFENELGSVFFPVSPNSPVFIDDFRIDSFPYFENKLSLQNLRMCSFSWNAFGIYFLHNLYSIDDIRVKNAAFFAFCCFVDMMNAFFQLLFQRNCVDCIILKSDTHLLVCSDIILKQNA